MRKHILKQLKRRILSPWWIFLIDLIITANAFIWAYIIRLNFQLPNLTFEVFVGTVSSVVAVYGFWFLIFRSYRGVIRYTDMDEVVRLLYTCSAAMVMVLVLEAFGRVLQIEFFFIPWSVLVIHFLLTLLFCLLFRMVVRGVYVFLSHRKVDTKTLIYGAGDMGLMALEVLHKVKRVNYHVVGFIDDDPSKWNIKLHDIPVYKFFNIKQLVVDKGVRVIVLAISDLPKDKVRMITETCLDLGLEVKVLPAFDYWFEGKAAEKGIRDMRIEDLLGRDQIKLEMGRIQEGLNGKCVMITGAAGSIGSEIARQVLKFSVGTLVLVDQAESALYDLQQEIISVYDNAPFELVLADVSNPLRMRKVFDLYRPQVVFNASAYKHVPLMEANPYEALRVNVGGTRNLADLSVEFGVEKFVMVSTDKAVNPTNVMGASKRVCEIYIQALAQRDDIKTSFITTRFGNVLGSSGSVIPLFKKQIERGGPLTVTHPDITRFFMTIPEACQLVLEAGFMGHGGEIFVFDMGQPVKIVDLAKKMVRLAGLEPDEDIEIKYTGLRPGEKLYEELLATKENTLPTYNDKIMIGQVRDHNYKTVNASVCAMLYALNEESAEMLVKRMKDLVPEYVSNNSVYECLDHVEKKMDEVSPQPLKGSFITAR